MSGGLTYVVELWLTKRDDARAILVACSVFATTTSQTRVLYPNVSTLSTFLGRQ